MHDPRIPDDLPVVVEYRGRAEGRAWLARLPGLLDAAAERWDLDLGEPFRRGSAAWVAPVTCRSDSSEAVLKVTMPHREATHEGAALRLWDGEGAVRLLAEDLASSTLLIERCRPGTHLSHDPAPVDERLAVAADLLSRLWHCPVSEDAPFETVDQVCAEWADLVRRRMASTALALDPGLVEKGATLLETLPASADRQVLVHGDFNPGNVLRAERQPWLAIDAKPMVGDPGYDPWPLVTQIEGGEATGPDRDQLRRHFDVVAGLVDEPVERLVAWSTARTVEAALWHVSLSEPDAALDTMAWARAFADLGGL